MLDRQGYTMVTTNGTIRVLGIDGKLATLAYRNVVKKIYPNNMLTTSSTVANLEWCPTYMLSNYHIIT